MAAIPTAENPHSSGRIGVIGAGTMGSGIAQSAVLHGYDVVLLDHVPEMVTRASAQIGHAMQRAVAKGRMSEAMATAAQTRLHSGREWADLEGCSLVIEAIIEQAAAKAALFAALSQVLAAETVLATNTSSFKVDDLAEAVRHPERFLGLHYFFPAASNPLLEVIRGRATADTAVAFAFAFAANTGKQAIVCRDAFGFAVNRFFVPYLNEAVRLREEGFAPAMIDAVACSLFATVAGPFRVMDLTKPAIALHACRTLAQLGAFYQPATALEQVGESGVLWQAGEVALAAVPAAIARSIGNRLRAAVFLAVLQALDEEVATPEALDQGARLGLQWGQPPVAQMQALGAATVHALLQPVTERYETPFPQSLARLMG